MQKIIRRRFFGWVAGALAVMTGAKVAALATEDKAIVPLAEPLPVPKCDPRNDVTVAVRNFFANRNPLVSRLPWVPEKESQFPLCLRRFTTMEEMEAAGVFTVGGRLVVHSGVTQDIERFCYRVGVGRPSSPRRVSPIPGGVQSPFDFEMTVQLQNMIDDVENALYHGIGVYIGVTGPRMKGLRYLLKTNNRVVPVANGKVSKSFLVDTVAAARANGGEADVLLLSSDLFRKKRNPEMEFRRIAAGDTIYGTPINIYEDDDLPGTSIIECPLLHTFTAVALTSSQVCIRTALNPSWHERPDGGGDWKFDCALDVTNEHHHSWTEGRSV